MKRVMPFLFVLLIALTGCVDIDIATKIDRDGSGMQTWQFETSALVASQLKEFIQNDPYFQKLPGKIQEQFREGKYELTWEVPFKDIKELEENWHLYHFETRGLFRKRYSYSEVWDVTNGSRLKELNKKVGSLVPITVKVSVAVPGNIVDSNADRTEGNVAYWDIPVNELASAKTLTIHSEEWNRALLLIAGVILFFALIGVAVVGLLSMRKPKVAGAATVCASCGNVLPSGSTFCNRCGAKV